MTSVGVLRSLATSSGSGVSNLITPTPSEDLFPSCDAEASLQCIAAVSAGVIP